MKKRILIVDDSDENREILREVLEADYILEEAVNGLEGLSKYVSFKPEIILLDVMMPHMDGRAVLKSIRQTEEDHGIFIGNGAVPIIMLTAYKEPWLESFKGGCDSYVMKPFEAKKLLVLIEETLKKNASGV